MSDFLENKLLDWLFRGQAIGITGASAAAGTGPANLYIGLFTTNPTDGTSGTEVTGNAYARVAVASSLANWAGTQAALSTVASSGTSGTTSNNGVLSFPTPSASWGTVNGMAIFDAASGGNMLIWSGLTQSKLINSGDSVTFPASSLSFQIDN